MPSPKSSFFFCRTCSLLTALGEKKILLCLLSLRVLADSPRHSSTYRCITRSTRKLSSFMSSHASSLFVCLCLSLFCFSLSFVSPSSPRDSQPLSFYIYTSVSLSVLLSVFLPPYLSFLSPYPDPGSSASAVSVSISLSLCFSLRLSSPPSSPPTLIFLRLLPSKSPCRQPGHSLGRTCWGIS